MLNQLTNKKPVSGKLTNQRPCPMMAMDLSVHNMDRDNNNYVRVEELSLAKARAMEAVIRSEGSPAAP